MEFGARIVANSDQSQLLRLTSTSENLEKAQALLDSSWFLVGQGKPRNQTAQQSKEVLLPMKEVVLNMSAARQKEMQLLDCLMRYHRQQAHVHLQQSGTSSGSVREVLTLQDYTSKRVTLQSLLGWRPLLGARTLLGAPGLTTRNKKLIVTKGIATSNKNALRLEAIAIRLEAIAIRLLTDCIQKERVFLECELMGRKNNQTNRLARKMSSFSSALETATTCALLVL